TDGRLFLKTVALILLNWAIAVGQFYILLRAFFPQAQPLWALFTLGVMALGVAVPSSPGAVGVQEVAIMGALAVFVDDPSTALAAALTARMSNYLITGILGAYALARDGLSLGGVYRDVRGIQQPTEDQDTP
ncbi:MAG: lysylphosphatidylglycerol synthase domain-containing protein, partial [Chloroflexota bacterium]